MPNDWAEIVALIHASDPSKSAICGAEHDVVFLNADEESIPSESETGQRLEALGAFYDGSYGCWCKFV